MTGRNLSPARHRITALRSEISMGRVRSLIEMENCCKKIGPLWVAARSCRRLRINERKSAQDRVNCDKADQAFLSGARMF
jgi:hypothetical protein